MYIVTTLRHCGGGDGGGESLPEMFTIVAVGVQWADSIIRASPSVVAFTISCILTCICTILVYRRGAQFNKAVGWKIGVITLVPYGVEIPASIKDNTWLIL